MEPRWWLRLHYCRHMGGRPKVQPSRDPYARLSSGMTERVPISHLTIAAAPGRVGQTLTAAGDWVPSQFDHSAHRRLSYDKERISAAACQRLECWLSYRSDAYGWLKECGRVPDWVVSRGLQLR
jgi:hypothetical protein